MIGRKSVIVNILTDRANEFSNDSSAFVISGIPGWNIRVRSRIWRPATDLYEVDDKIIVRVEIAGMSEGDLSITYYHGILSIGGVRSEIAERKAFHQLEIPFGEFLTEIEIPVPVDIDNIEAHYSDGFLWVELPKARPTQVKIQNEE
jgi:HSP20 family molecular chaperone IbpA